MKNIDLNNKSKKKRNFTVPEKIAVFIIVILIVIILLLIFNKQIIQLYESFKIWYEGS